MNVRDKIRWWKAELGVKLFGISVMIDLVNVCSFKCPSCPVGQEGARVGGKMSFDMFKKILDRIESQNKIRNLLLYSFSEPFLSNILPDCIREARRRGIKTMVSTNLSRPKNLEAALAAGLDELRISFSGFENGEYFHKGRDMEQFREACWQLNMMTTRGIRNENGVNMIPYTVKGSDRRYRTRVSLIFHMYKTNLHELEAVRLFAISHRFHLIKEKAFFIPYEKIVYGNYTDADRELIAHLQKSPEETEKVYDEICYYQQKQIVIDAEGKLYLCRHVYDKAYIVGDIFQDSLQSIRWNMKTHSFCLECKSRALNHYTP